MMKRLAKEVEKYHFDSRDGEGWYVPILWVMYLIFGWLDFSGEVQGHLVKGIPEAPPTSSRLMNLYLKFFGWKRGAYFRVSKEAAEAGYYVGYKATIGEKVAIALIPSYNPDFMVGIGHEDCTFFAIDRNRKEIPIKYIGTYSKAENVVRHAKEF